MISILTNNRLEIEILFDLFVSYQEMDVLIDSSIWNNHDYPLWKVLW